VLGSRSTDGLRYCQKGRETGEMLIWPVESDWTVMLEWDRGDQNQRFRAVKRKER
jgi:hypothetical protein